MQERKVRDVNVKYINQRGRFNIGVKKYKEVLVLN